MTWEYDTNNLISNVSINDGVGGALLGFARHLNSVGSYLIVGTGDGRFDFSNEGQTIPPYDILTEGVSTWNSGIDNEFSNTEAWIRLRMIGTSSFEMIIKRSVSSSASQKNNIKIIISPTGFTNNDAGPNSSPTASDQQFILGSAGSDLSTYWDLFPNIDNLYWHAGVEASDQDGFYPFYILVTNAGSQAIEGFFMFDPVISGIDNDIHPWVFYLPGGVLGANFSEIAGGTHGNGYKDFGGPSELFLKNIRAHGHRDADGNILMPGSIPPQAGDGQSRNIGFLWGNATENFYKGVSRNILWKGLSSRTYPETRDLTTNSAKIYVDDILIPWEQDTIPL